MDNICPICGKRFNQKQGNYEYCSDECYNISMKEKKIEWNKKNRISQSVNSDKATNPLQLLTYSDLSSQK